jgi:hypothetical protein
MNYSAFLASTRLSRSAASLVRRFKNKVCSTIALAALATLAQAQVTVTTSNSPIIGVGAVAGSSTSQITVQGTTAGVNNHPANEFPARVLDGFSNTKYLNFARTNVGIIVQATGSVAVSSFRLTTANDSANRDPITVTIEGTTATDPTTAAGGATWTLLYSGPTGLATDPGRQIQGPVISFANNNAPFNTYRVLFPTIRDAATANSMQVAEIALMGIPFTTGPATVAQQPQSRTNFVGQTATFTVRADGTPPYTYQWYSNSVLIADSTNSSHTTPVLGLGNSGTAYSVMVSNALGGALSANAILTVVESPVLANVSSRGNPTNVFVTFVKPVVLNSGSTGYVLTNSSGDSIPVLAQSYGENQSIVRLALGSALTSGTYYTVAVSGITAQDASSLSAASLSFLHGFAPLCADFTTGIPAGTLIQGSATNGGPTGADGILHLTDDNQAGVCGTFYISNMTGGTIGDRLVARWKSQIGGPLAGHADGYSLNWAAASEMPVGGCGLFTAEEGWGTGWSFNVDVYDGGAGPDTGIEIKWRGTRVAFQHIDRDANVSGNYLTKDVLVNAEGTVDPSGKATFTYDGNTIVGYAANFVGVTNGAILFAARTGGETDNLWIDDVCINSFTLGPVSISQSPTNTSALENTPVSFSVVADGTFPYYYSWYTNGVRVGGGGSATNSTYTIASAFEGFTNLQVYAVVSNAFSVATSSVATLSVVLNPRVLAVRAFSSNEVAVTFSRAVDVNSGTYNFSNGSADALRSYGSNHSVVVVTAGDLFTLDTAYSVEVLDVVSEVGAYPLLINPTNVSFFFGFGRFCADFAGGVLPPNVTLYGNAAINGDSVHITDAVGGQNGSLVISNLNGGNLLDRFRITYRMVLGGSANPADGYSLSIGNDVANQSGEEGSGSGLILAFDNYNNGAGESPAANAAPSIAVKWGGVFLTNFLTTGMRTDTFVPVVVNMEPDGTLDLIYNGVVIFNNFPTPFRGIVNPRFVWAARTGGAFENAWIDDICINDFVPGPVFFTQEPVDVTVLEGLPATFTAAVNGTFPFTYQWFTNGVAVPGARSSTFTIPVATEALNGAQIRVVVSNELGFATSSNATLHVDLSPRVVSVRARSTNEVVVTFTRSVDINTGNYYFPIGPGFATTSVYGSSQREVVVTLDVNFTPDTAYEAEIWDVVSLPGGLTLISNPTNFLFLAGGGAASTNFATGLPAGGALFGSAVVSPDGILHLTDDNQTGVCGALYISNRTSALNSDQLIATWRSRIGGPLNGNADGFSFNWGSDVPVGCGNAEEGAGTGLSFTVDTYDNGAGPDNGIEIKWQGNRLAFLHVDRNGVGASNYLTKDVFVDAYVSVQPNGRVTFIYDGNILTTNIPNWTGISNGAYSFVSRTGGQSDNVWIDDLHINDFSLGPIAITTQPANTSVPFGSRARLTVGLDGLPPYGIQWYSNNVAIAGATFPIYNTAPLTTAGTNAQYTVVVSNYSGSITSNVAVVSAAQNAGSLSITRSTSDITITWNNPQAVLQRTLSLTPPVTWADVSISSPYVQSTTNVGVPANAFYRLILR